MLLLAPACHGHSSSSPRVFLSSASATETMWSWKPQWRNDTCLPPSLPLEPWDNPPPFWLPTLSPEGLLICCEPGFSRIGWAFGEQPSLPVQAVEAGALEMGLRHTGGSLEAELRLLQQQTAIAAPHSAHSLSHHG